MADLLFERAPIGMAVLDRDGATVRANAAMVALAGPLAAGVPIVAAFCPTCRDDVRTALAESLAGGETRPFAAAVPGPDGSRAVQVRPTPLYGADGRCGGLVLHVLDLTAQTRLEAQPAHGKRLQALGALAGGIAHDFNNLLTAILGAADEALQHPGLDPSLYDGLRHIRGGAQRGAALVAGLLASGRPRAPGPEVVRVNDAVRDISGLLRRLLGQQVRLEVELEEPGRLVRVDPTQLDQALLNLAVNARDAMPGGGRLTVRTGHLTLPEPQSHGAERVQPGRYVTIEVADTGCGIPPEVLPRIFDPYFTTKRDRGGSGLGLASVRGAARQAAGFVSVESEPGRGARFRVHLPLHEGPPPLPTPPPPRRPTASPPTRRLLLVDDEEAVRRLAERALTQRGWPVLAADSAEAALELVAGSGGAGGLALVVSDAVMPGMGGAALIRLLREAQPGLPAILTSGYADEAQRRAADAEGAGFLAKPYTPRALAALIKVTLSRHSTICS